MYQRSTYNQRLVPPKTTQIGVTPNLIINVGRIAAAQALSNPEE
jgi:hypothetical protein